MFWNKKKTPRIDLSEYPTRDQYLERRVRNLALKHQAAEEEYEYALSQARRALKEIMWQGQAVLLMDVSGVKGIDVGSAITLIYRNHRYISKENLDRVGLDLVEELHARGYTDAVYDYQWNDKYSAIKVDPKGGNG